MVVDIHATINLYVRTLKSRFINNFIDITLARHVCFNLKSCIISLLYLRNVKSAILYAKLLPQLESLYFISIFVVSYQFWISSINLYCIEEWKFAEENKY